MQIKPDDEELKSYFISVQELAKMLHISAANLYRDMDTITDVYFNKSCSNKRLSTRKIHENTMGNSMCL